ncbi:MAG: lipoprotein [Bacilli bacterium]
MKKILLLLLTTILLTGCSANYNLTITDKEIKENITLEVPTNMPDSQKKTFEDYINYETKPYQDALKDYEIINEGSTYDISYTYKNNEIKKSKILNNCFQYKVIKETKNYYMFNLSGEFKCLHDNNKININIKAKNKIKQNNAEKTDYKENYKWTINKKNKDNVNIQLVVLKNNGLKDATNTLKELIINTLIISLIIAIIILGLYILKKVFIVIDKITNNE